MFRITDHRKSTFCVAACTMGACSLGAIALGAYRATRKSFSCTTPSYDTKSSTSSDRLGTITCTGVTNGQQYDITWPPDHYEDVNGSGNSGATSVVASGTTITFTATAAQFAYTPYGTEAQIVVHHHGALPNDSYSLLPPMAYLTNIHDGGEITTTPNQVPVTFSYHGLNGSHSISYDSSYWDPSLSASTFTATSGTGSFTLTTYANVATIDTPVVTGGATDHVRMRSQ